MAAPARRLRLTAGVVAVVLWQAVAPETAAVASVAQGAGSGRPMSYGKQQGTSYGVGDAALTGTRRGPARPGTAADAAGTAADGRPRTADARGGAVDARGTANGKHGTAPRDRDADPDRDADRDAARGPDRPRRTDADPDRPRRADPDRPRGSGGLAGNGAGEGRRHPGRPHTAPTPGDATAPPRPDRPRRPAPPTPPHRGTPRAPGADRPAPPTPPRHAPPDPGRTPRPGPPAPPAAPRPDRPTAPRPPHSDRSPAPTATPHGKRRDAHPRPGADRDRPRGHRPGHPRGSAPGPAGPPHSGPRHPAPYRSSNAPVPGTDHTPDPAQSLTFVPDTQADATDRAPRHSSGTADRVLPLGTGMTLTGLGLAYFALRLRRR
ncbi:hypothetical protein [Streptomyces sp. 184]|uniref:hypothetical protein n=1 Tax=Streptomyces sp. 184 TaxID=1827526 RepID=UPI0038919FD6